MSCGHGAPAPRATPPGRRIATLDEHDVAGAQHARGHGRRPRRVGTVGARPGRRRVDAARARRRDQRRRRARARAPPPRGGSARRRSPSSAMLAEHGDACGARRRVRAGAQRGPHRDRVRVEGVVDQRRRRRGAASSSPRQRESATVAAPSPPVERQPERIVGARARRARSRLVPRREREVDARDRRARDRAPRSRSRSTSASRASHAARRRGRRGGTARAAARPGRSPCRPAGSAASSSPFARATPSTIADELEVAGPDAVITPMSGRAIRAELRDLAEAAHPQLDEQTSVSGSSRQSVSGTPSSLLKLASAATVRACGAQSAARMSFVEVLPVEPVIPTTRARAAVAHAPRERGESGVRRRRARASPRRPRARASATKSAPPSPTATNRSPGPTRRESICTPVISSPAAALEPAAAERREPRRRASGITRASAQRLARDLAVVERDASRRRSPGPARGPCPRSRRRRPGRGRPDRARDRARGGRARPRRPARLPRASSWMIASGSSQRGLSVVTIDDGRQLATATGPSAAAWRGRGRRRRRRRTSTRPVGMSRAAREHVARASPGVCA